MSKQYLSIFLFTFIFAQFVSSCSGNDKETLFESVLELEVGNSSEEIIGYGTAFMADDNICLTNAHNVIYKVQDSIFEVYKYIVGRVYSSKVIIKFDVSFYSYEDDIARLVPVGDENSTISSIKSLKVNKSTKYEVGSYCFCIGNLNNYGLSFNSGYISSQLKTIKYHDKENDFIQTSIEISKGVSGCPLFNNNNEVIGIMTFKLRDDSYEYIDGLSFAIPIIRAL